MCQLNIKPLIGISANLIDDNSALHFAYALSVANAGGIPLIIPYSSDDQVLESTVAELDAIVLSGGSDIDASYFGEENVGALCDVDLRRDDYEFKLLRIALNYNLPVLGICRGFQVINVALGGSIYQDIPTMYPENYLEHKVLENRHLPVHNVNIEKDSKLFEVLGEDKIGVNSIHHQALKEIAPSLRVVARSDDGIVEAVEAYPIYKILGVQWHPERMAYEDKDNRMNKLFQFIVAEGCLYHRAKKLHRENIIIDSHCDTPMLYDDGVDFDMRIRNKDAKVDPVKMFEGRVDATITVAYIPNSTPKELANKKTHEIFDRFIADIQSNNDKIVLVKDLSELYSVKQCNKRAVILGVENALALSGSIEALEPLNKLGVSYITLCHNGANDVCDSAVGERVYNGLSDFGSKVVRRMNELGITVDVSHTDEKTVFDVLSISSQPIIASHSSAKALLDHPRNLSDEAIRAIADKGGVIQVCGYQGFLQKDSSKASLMDLVNHLEYIVDLVGYEAVGVGSDFDGGTGMPGFDGANDFMNITVELLRRGHSDENIAQIMGKNIFRVLSNNRSHLKRTEMLWY